MGSWYKSGDPFIRSHIPLLFADIGHFRIPPFGISAVKASSPCLLQTPRFPPQRTVHHSILETDPLTGNTGSRSPRQNCSHYSASGIKYAGTAEYHKYNLDGQMYRLCQQQPVLYHDSYRLLLVTHFYTFPKTINSYGSIVYTSPSGISLPS